MSHRWPSHGAETEWSSGSYCWCLLKWHLRSVSITSHLLIYSESLHKSSPAKWFQNRVRAVEDGVVTSYERFMPNWGWAWAEVYTDSLLDFCLWKGLTCLSTPLLWGKFPSEGKEKKHNLEKSKFSLSLTLGASVSAIWNQIIHP